MLTFNYPQGDMFMKKSHLLAFSFLIFFGTLGQAQTHSLTKLAATDKYRVTLLEVVLNEANVNSRNLYLSFDLCVLPDDKTQDFVCTSLGYSPTALEVTQKSPSDFPVNYSAPNVFLGETINKAADKLGVPGKFSIVISLYDSKWGRDEYLDFYEDNILSYADVIDSTTKSNISIGDPDSTHAVIGIQFKKNKEIK